MHSPTPPVPIAAELNQATNRLTITFDQDILALFPLGVLNLVVYTGTQRRRHFSILSITGPVLLAQQNTPTANATAPGTDYLATPPSLTGLTGLPVAAFTSYPTSFI